MPFMAPIMLLAALIPIGGMLAMQADHDTRGGTNFRSPLEHEAEQVRTRNINEARGRSQVLDAPGWQQDPSRVDF
ncbi:hypothetical protein T484DRAFT_1827148 [Baffinella frigidus]|nr:hypothetical protein T484DRAFT_1827148 [Cryptophyta sp. CCMP2293]|eukprot:CAMPEP_0180154098 /NCGR_PEP_ID=MMETSP0986-20121125/23952_1 /TAXON_ID=697907 /ORGANISM="non described non described, Strain CCMP2293" /LENGTH=74 /DNA_ID=CAMNT_0022102379 /DNA_START=44 /DNA_END=268 /DNA_ORIENTATION=+